MKRASILLAFCVALSGCSNSDSHPNRDPGKPESRSMRGYVYHVDTMQGSDGKFRWVQSAVEGYRRARSDDLPSKVEYLPNSGCDFPQKQQDQIANVVHIASARQPTSIYHIPSKDLSDRAKAFTTAYVKRKGDIPQTVTFTAGRQMMTANVVVTETRPSILVLISQTDVIWNFQIADNANLQQVVLIGRQEAGVANLPDHIKLHSVNGARLKSCGLNTWRYPREHWKFIADMSNNKSSSDKELLAKERTNGQKFQNWIANNFKVPANDVLGDSAISNFLIGPLPDAGKLEFKPFRGAVIKISEARNLTVAKRDDFRAISQQLVMDTAKKAAGGDLSKLIVGGQK